MFDIYLLLNRDGLSFLFFFFYFFLRKEKNHKVSVRRAEIVNLQRLGLARLQSFMLALATDAYNPSTPEAERGRLS